LKEIRKKIQIGIIWQTAERCCNANKEVWKLRKKFHFFEFGSIKDGCRLLLTLIFQGRFSRRLKKRLLPLLLSLAIAREIMRSANR
jgi:hypothetical protein